MEENEVFKRNILIKIIAKEPILKIKRALISVFDKSGVVEFAQFLTDNDVEILSTGGTYKVLSEAGINCVPVEEFTGLKEFFGGRVKTLHPLIHGGILSKRDKEAEEIGIKQIDLVVVNLYPFESIVENGEKDIDKLIEMIDIGGPTMLRSAAKNYKYTCSVSSPDFYSEIMEQITKGEITEETRLKMALYTFRLTSYYDGVINTILSQYTDSEETFSDFTTIPLKKNIEMRYGENPHQNAAFYSFVDYPEKRVSDFFEKGKRHGKQLSYNNILDISAIIKILSDLPDKSCVVLKHSNPCGAAIDETIYKSFMSAYEGDPVSIFGGIVGVKGELDKDTAAKMSEIFLEIIIAEKISDEAFEILSKKKNIRLMEYAQWKDIFFKDKSKEFRKATGGMLIQEKDTLSPFDEKVEIVTDTKADDYTMKNLIFAQTMVKHVKSNAIVVVKDMKLIGVGAGQMNRVTAARIALDWAKEKAEGAVMASDAFFPMDDTVRLAAGYGIKAIIQPGGSIKDQDSIDACNELKIAMGVTGKRHFYH